MCYFLAPPPKQSKLDGEVVTLHLRLCSEGKKPHLLAILRFQK